MNTDWTPVSLAAFERDIADCFNRGEIKAPVHLAGGNERQLIDLFKNVEKDDWVCCTWRSHYHCLLKGVPPEQVKRAIIEGRSIALCFPEYRIISSALVGGIIPIALGLAWAEKQAAKTFPVITTKTMTIKMNKVWCFIGDMAARSGISHDCLCYAEGHELPLNFVIEDNGLSVATDTAEAWGIPTKKFEVDGYQYELLWPHVGVGKWVHMQ